jgi:hypothetical protein
MQQDEAEPIPSITIRRDWLKHRWVYWLGGQHDVCTPRSDDAPADRVIRWLKFAANGRLNVKVDLS